MIERIGDARLRLYLYHIPALTGVPIAHGVIERLLRDFPGLVVGIKDSSGDWANLQAMLERFPELAIFPASESLVTRSRAWARAAASRPRSISTRPASPSWWRAGTRPRARPCRLRPTACARWCRRGP